MEWIKTRPKRHVTFYDGGVLVRAQVVEETLSAIGTRRLLVLPEGGRDAMWLQGWRVLDDTGAGWGTGR